MQIEITDNFCEAFAVIKAVYDAKKNIADYTFIEVNSFFEKMMGKKKENILNQCFFNFFKEISEEKKNMLLQVIKFHKSFEYYKYFDYFCKHYKITIYNIAPDCACIIFNDITGVLPYALKSRCTSKLTGINNNCFLDIIDNMIDIVCETDLNGVIEYVNRRFYNVIGYSPSEVIGSYIFDFIHLDERNDAIRTFKEFISNTNDGRNTSEYRFKKSDGSYIYIQSIAKLIYDESNCCYRSIINMRNITENKCMEKKLRESEYRFRKIFQDSPKGIVLCDSNGKVIECNQCAYDMTGYDNIDDFQKLNLYDSLFLPEECKLKLIKGHKVRSQFKINYDKIKKSNSRIRNFQGIRYFDAIFTPLTNNEYLIMVEDITEIKQYEEELKKAKLSAEKANNAKSSFIANISHEIRTPINGISGVIDLLMESQLSNEQKDYLMLAKLSSKVLLDTVNSILDLSKIESGKLELEEIPLNLHKTIQNVVKQFEISAQNKGITLNCNISSDVPEYVIGDPVRISRILLNLLGNGIKFTKHGSVTLSVNTRFISKEYAEIGFCIEDTGIGIPKDKISKLFKSFSQVDSSTTREFGGTGLGLAICKQIVEMFSGKIWVESVEGKGSKFSFFIKLRRSSDNIKSLNKQKPKNEIDSSNIDLTGLKILVVEDNFINQKLVGKMLTNKKCILKTVSNGIEALKIIQKANFDAILMDVQMPKLDGFQVTKKIREIEKDTGEHRVIIGMTAFSIKDDIQKCINCGMDEYLSKPIKINELYNMLKKYKDDKLSC